MVIVHLFRCTLLSLYTAVCTVILLLEFCGDERLKVRHVLVSADAENSEAADLQRKLEMLNNVMDQEARAEQARRQMQYFGHSGYSEDSDYTSDLNYPVGQHANSSASQFRSAAHQMHTPQRSLETSRENSYERDDAPAGHHGRAANSTAHDDYGHATEADPLYYNSRPRGYKEYR
ncbi:hypothetical protein B566_EDAN005886 [Ephemera danica]|nr:hypothetical protein B566_EDAN005886 [Ephemera danica]